MGIVIGKGCGGAIDHALLHRGIEADNAFISINRFDRHIEVRAAVIGDERQACIPILRCQITCQILLGPVSCATRRAPWANASAISSARRVLIVDYRVFSVRRRFT